jgi:hypothetical protein
MMNQFTLFTLLYSMKDDEEKKQSEEQRRVEFGV